MKIILNILGKITQKDILVKFPNATKNKLKKQISKLKLMTKIDELIEDDEQACVRNEAKYLLH